MSSILGKRILLVDDDPALLEALPEALHLRMEHLEVDTAASGATALEQIAQIEYDAIVADFKMPGMDGLALLANVKALRPETPTLLITGHSDEALAIEALRAGAADYIPKPIDRDYFVASLNRALQVTHLNRQMHEQRQALEQQAALLERAVQERTRLLLEADQAKDALLEQVETLADLLRQRAAELSTIIESMADGVYVCTADWQAVRVNASGAALLGMTVEQASRTISEQRGHGASRRLDGSPLPREEAPLAQALRGVTRTDYRLMIRRADTGEDRQVRVSAAPIRNQVGEITGAVAVASDITRMVQLERQKDEFLNIASHELRTPLTSLKLLAQLIRRQLERADFPQIRYVGRMERAVTRMERLIADLLDIARIEAGTLIIRPTPCDVAALCRQVVDEQRALTGRTMTLQVPKESVVASLDRERIQQVLENLLSNALKYSPSGRPVSLTLTEEQERLLLCVRDVGPGIPAEALPHLFDRFYRVPDMEVQSGSGVGLGLGLHICREIVRQHGGQIWAESTLGSGSAFYVALPVRQTSEPRSHSSDRATGHLPPPDLPLSDEPASRADKEDDLEALP